MGASFLRRLSSQVFSEWVQLVQKLTRDSYLLKVIIPGSIKSWIQNSEVDWLWNIWGTVIQLVLHIVFNLSMLFINLIPKVWTIKIFWTWMKTCNQRVWLEGIFTTLVCQCLQFSTWNLDNCLIMGNKVLDWY